MEIWKEIKGFSGMYKVSNLGRIKSFKTDKKGKILKGSFDRDGYKVIRLINNTISKTAFIHRIVLSAFKPNVDANILTVNHKNEIKDDNRLVNLEWMTIRENTRYSTAWKFTDEKGNLYLSTRDAEQRLGISRETIRNILNGKYKENRWGLVLKLVK